MRRIRCAPVALTVLVLVGAACGSDGAAPGDTAATDDGAPAITADGPGDAGGAETTTSGGPTTTDLPPPDASTFVGRNRVVNLWVDDTGATQDIDVWARRSFTAGPVLLVEGLGFGEVSDYFAAPPGHSVVFVAAGAGPDAEELGGLFSAEEGEQILGAYTWDGTGSSSPNYWEVDPDSDQTPPRPSGGHGLVLLRTPQLRAFEEALAESVGADSFYVGGPDGGCLDQLLPVGTTPSVLGGTQPVYLELAPGTHTIGLYPWPAADECDGEPAHTFDVEVTEGTITNAWVHTRDGESLDVLLFDTELE